MRLSLRLAVALALLAPLAVSAQGAPRPRPPAGPAPARSAPARPAAASSTGTYLATRIDREPLPLADQVVDDDGTKYLIEFERMVLSLRADNTFRASVRFRRTLFAASSRTRGRQVPLQSMTVTGRYSIADSSIRFTPDDTPETRGLRMMSGTVRSARELSVPFRYRNGQRERDRTLVMTRRDDIL